MVFSITLPLAMAALHGTAHAALVVSNKGTENVNCSAGVCMGTARKATLNINELAEMLAGGNVTLVSGHAAKDIVIKAALNWTASTNLTFDSYRSITFERPVVVAGPGGLTIATNDGGADGDYQFVKRGHIEFWDTTSSLIINGNAYTLAKSIRQIRTASNDASPYIALSRNINAGRRTYTTAPIPEFRSTLEGLGNSISNLTIDDTQDRDSIGLIGMLTQTGQVQAVVRDIGIVLANVKGEGREQSIGVLVGQSSGKKITNSYTTGVATATNSATSIGGLVGDNADANVSKSHAEVTVSGTAGALQVGGLIGSVEGTCSGGCVGFVDQTYSTGAVSAGDETYAGGLIGSNSAGTITNSYATGSVTTGASAFAGGLLGINANGAGSDVPTIAASYSVGAVTGGSDTLVGGLIGKDSATLSVTNSYWDLDTSNVNDPSRGAGNVSNDPGITGLTTEQFQSSLPSGFAASIWQEALGVNGGYPYLIAQSP